MKKEADKCMLLCRNCHSELHYEFWKKSKLERLNRNKDISGG